MQSHRSPGRRFGMILAVAFIVYSLLGFVVAPPVLKSQLVKRLSSELGRSVRIADVRMNPWILSLTIEGLAIADRDKGGLVSWDRVYVNFDVVSFFVKEWRFQEIIAAAPVARVIVNEDRSLNFSDLITKFGAKPDGADEPAWPIRVAKLTVTGAVLDFTDLSRARDFKTRVGPVAFSLVQFHTAPNRDAPYAFDAATESGEKLRWVGTVSINPLGSDGEFTITGLQLAKYAPYYHHLVNLDILSGGLDVSGRYEVAMAEGAPLARISESQVHLTGFKVAEAGSTAPVLELDDLNISGVSGDVQALTARVKSIALDGGRASLRRLPDGTINALAMIKPVPDDSPAEVASATPAEATAPALQLEVETLSVRGFSGVFEDQALERPVTQTLVNLEVDVEKFTFAEGATIPMRLQLTLPQQAAVTVNGSFGLHPLQAVLALDVSAFSLAMVSPYVEPWVNVRVIQGTFSAQGEARLRLPAGADPEINYTGSVTLERFAAIDGVVKQPLASWAELSLRGIDFKAAPLAVSVQELMWNEPEAHVVISPDKSINLLAIMPAEKPATEDAASPAPEPGVAVRPKIDVAHVVIKDGTFTFTDRSLQPEVQTAINGFSGTIDGLSSDNPARADVKVQATVNGSGPVAISGKLDPLGPTKFIDVRVELKDVELTPFSPYSGKFAGFELARGKLFWDVNARLSDRAVEMKNAVTLSQFTFGAPTESPDATKLPVRLAVALLKDVDGKIVLDLPVEGSLDDPKFRIGGVIFQIIGNLLTKAAVSPFSLLGAMFGGGGDELAFQDFEPGNADLTPDNLKKLETLTKALKGRPALNLEISGAFDVAVDAPALKQRRLAQTVRTAVWEKHRRTDATVPPPDQLVVSAEDELAEVSELYAQKFTAEMAPMEPELATPSEVVTAAESPRKGLLRRVWDLATFKSWRERKSEENGEPPNPATVRPEEPGLAESVTGPALEEMKARLADAIEVTDGDLRQLALARAQRVRDYFLQQEINAERLFLANIPNESKGARAWLQLQ